MTNKWTLSPFLWSDVIEQVIGQNPVCLETLEVLTSSRVMTLCSVLRSVGKNSMDQACPQGCISIAVLT